MLYKLQDRIRKTCFNIQCKDILSTPPLAPDKSGLVIASEVGKSDISMYLTAIKSLYYFLKKGQIAILVDKDIPKKSLEILKYHLSPLQIAYVEDNRSDKCPEGGTWERLLFIASLVENHYVLQLDSDTLTLGDISEVKDCIAQNRSFTIGTWQKQEIEPMKVSCERANKRGYGHRVQILAEKNFHKLKDYEKLKYVRGQSAFCGFAKGSFSREKLEDFSQKMTDILGHKKWSEWGSESVASNYIIANTPGSSVLPYPKYATYYPNRNVDYRDCSFIHFQGMDRFKKGFYAKKAKEFIAKCLGDE